MKDFIEIIASLSGNGFLVVLVGLFVICGFWLLAKLGSAAITAWSTKVPKRDASTDSGIHSPMCILHNNHLDILISSMASVKSSVEAIARNQKQAIEILSVKNADRTKAIYVPEELMGEIRSILNNIEKIPTDKLPSDFVSDLLKRLDAVEFAIKQLG